jgi:hypothetical protein
MDLGVRIAFHAGLTLFSAAALADDVATVVIKGTAEEGREAARAHLAAVPGGTGLVSAEVFEKGRSAAPRTSYENNPNVTTGPNAFGKLVKQTNYDNSSDTVSSRQRHGDRIRSVAHRIGPRYQITPDWLVFSNVTRSVEPPERLV